MTKLESIEKHGLTARGCRELKKYLKTGKKLTYKQALLAKCYECMGYYADGKVDCKSPDCPCYPYMPFKINSKVVEVQKKSVLQKKKRKLGG